MVGRARVRRRCIRVASLLACLAAARGSAQSNAGAPFTVDALLRLEGIGAVAPSPSGKYVARKGLAQILAGVKSYVG